jgi:hypothetical protein
MPEPELWLSDSRGIYIPRDFALSFNDRAEAVRGVSAEDWAILEAGPDHAHYWDTWEEVLNDAIVTMDGTEYFLHQDGDLWLIPDGMVWSDKREFFVWPEDEDEEDEDDDDEDKEKEDT